MSRLVRIDRKNSRITGKTEVAFFTFSGGLRRRCPEVGLEEMRARSAFALQIHYVVGNVVDYFALPLREHSNEMSGEQRDIVRLVFFLASSPHTQCRS
jgi:hypothetical protein